MDTLSYELRYTPPVSSSSGESFPHAAFLVNGLGLDTFIRQHGDVGADFWEGAGVIGMYDFDGPDDVALWLLDEAPAPFVDGRAPLSVCEACGDYYCGALTVFVSRVGNVVEWRSLGKTKDGALDEGFEWDGKEFQPIEGFVPKFDVPKPAVRTLRFDRDHLRSVLAAAFLAVQAAPIRRAPVEPTEERM